MKPGADLGGGSGEVFTAVLEVNPNVLGAHSFAGHSHVLGMRHFSLSTEKEYVSFH